MPDSLRRERLLLLTLTAANFSHIMDFMIMMPLGPQLMRIFDISPQQFSLLVSGYTFSAGTAGLIAAFVLDRFDRRHALIVVYIGFILGTVACALSPTYVALLLARVITGAFGGVLSALILSIIGDVIPLERRGWAMGILGAAFSISSVFGVPFGLYLANLYGWHAPFIFVAAFGLPLLALLWKMVPPIRDHLDSESLGERGFFSVITNLWVHKNQLRALGFTFLLVLSHFGLIPFIAPYMVHNVGFTEMQLTYIYLLGGAATIISNPLVGRLSDKVGKPRVFVIFAILTILPVWLITNLPPVALALALLITSIFFVTASGRWVPALAMITSAVRAENRGSFMSINAAVQQFTAGLAASIGGLIVGEGVNGQITRYNYLGYFSVAILLFTILMARRIKPVS